MITIEQAKNLKYRDVVVCDGNKWRVNGEIKLWKTRPQEFNLPLKHGLYSYGCLNHENAKYFTIEA